jgi:hypothetical protein
MGTGFEFEPTPIGNYLKKENYNTLNIQAL